MAYVSCRVRGEEDKLIDSTSLHPFGTLVEELGPIGDAEVETSALLKDCNFPTEEFNELAVKCLPPLPWR
jgi:protein SSD1